MKYFYCQGELHKAKAVYTINRHGYHLIIDDVPAWVCDQCGEPLFEETQVDAIQQLIQKIDASIPLMLKVAV
jgi:YgiT-type zinc finger domain-containing protein